MPTAKWLLLFLAFSCAKQNPWKLDTIQSHNKQYCSSRLVYQNNDVRLTLLHNQDKNFAYLDFLSSTYFNPDDIQINLNIDQTSLLVTGKLLEGKQRLCLDPKALNAILTALQENKEINLSIDDYELTINSENFSKKYSHLIKPSILYNLKNRFSTK